MCDKPQKKKTEALCGQSEIRKTKTYNAGNEDDAKLNTPTIIFRAPSFRDMGVDGNV